jgi:hypothetical protein
MARHVNFQFYPLRFELVATDRLTFPAGKAANTLRGAIGIIFRSHACEPECAAQGDSRHCEHRHTCIYAKAFEPIASARGPSGLADSPRPFALRVRHLDGKTFQPGQTFHVDLNLFSLDPDILRLLVLTFATLSREGLGPNRAKVELRQVTGTEPLTLSLEPGQQTANKIRVEFLSPTELKHDGQITDRPEFPVLFARIRDRISILRDLYGSGPLEIDFNAIGARAALVQMTDCQMTHNEVTRRSTRTGQVHSIGGFTGHADYEGDLTEFLPWLEIARYTGVGRQAVWGKGEISTIRLK